MAKRALRIQFRLPPYEPPRNEWRKQIHAAALAKRGAVRYEPDDCLEVDVRLYFGLRPLGFHDVDNRLKDVLDALQGGTGGSKALRTLEPIIPNDRQIYRVVVEKSEPPPQSSGLGHVIVRGFEPVRLRRA